MHISDMLDHWAPNRGPSAVSRVVTIVLGCLLVIVGLRLCWAGGAGWCPFETMPKSLTNIVGVGFAAGGFLLFSPRTTLLGLFLSMVWILAWTWAPSRRLWNHRSCWQAAIALAALFLNMGLLGLSDARARPDRETKLVLFFALAFLVAATGLWLKSR